MSLLNNIQPSASTQFVVMTPEQLQQLLDQTAEKAATLALSRYRDNEFLDTKAICKELNIKSLSRAREIILEILAANPNTKEVINTASRGKNNSSGRGKLSATRGAVRRHVGLK